MTWLIFALIVSDDSKVLNLCGNQTLQILRNLRFKEFSRELIFAKLTQTRKTLEI